MAIVQVFVTDRDSGAPIEGALVGVCLSSPRETGGFDGPRDAVLSEGVTDARGIFELRAEDRAEGPAEAWVSVRARGHREWRSGGRKANKVGGPTVIPLPIVPSGGVLRLDVAMEPGATLYGRVTDAEDRPVAGAHVGLVASSARACSWPHATSLSATLSWPPAVTTDADGGFEWLALPFAWRAFRDGWSLVLLLDHDEHGAGFVHRLETLPVGPDGRVAVRARLEGGTAVTGRVLAADGSPVVGARVHAVADEVAGQPVCVRVEKDAETDAEGEFVLRGLARRAQRLEVEASAHAPWRGRVDPTEAERRPLEIRLEPGTDLEGRVLHRDGSPAADVRVFASTGSGALLVMRATRTDEEGRFRLLGLPPQGTANVRSNVCVERAVELPSPPITLQAPPLRELRVVAVHASTGLVLVEAGIVRAAGNSFSTILFPGADGAYGGKELPAGRYELRAVVPGYVGPCVTYELLPDGPLETVELRVRPGGVVLGRVVDAAGRGLAGVSVNAVQSSVDPLSTVTDAAGGFELRGLAPSAELLLTSGEFAMHVAALADTGSPDAPVRLDVVLGPGATVRGSVRSRAGRPAPGVLVSVAFAEKPQIPYPFPSAVSDADGHFLLERVPVGPLVLVAGTVRVPFLAEHGAVLERDLEPA